MIAEEPRRCLRTYWQGGRLGQGFGSRSARCSLALMVFRCPLDSRCSAGLSRWWDNGIAPGWTEGLHVCRKGLWSQKGAAKGPIPKGRWLVNKAYHSAHIRSHATPGANRRSNRRPTGVDGCLRGLARWLPRVPSSPTTHRLENFKFSYPVGLSLRPLPAADHPHIF
jgi:hypothetical protein